MPRNNCRILADDLLVVGHCPAFVQRADVRLGELVSETAEFKGDLRRRQHQVNVVGGNGAAGHPGIAGAFRGLHNGDSALRLNGLEAEGAVGVRPGKDHADRIVLIVTGKRAEKRIDDPVRHSVFIRQLFHVEHALPQDHTLVGLHHVELVGHGALPVDQRSDRHARMPLEDFREIAALVGGEVGDQHERHTGIGVKVSQDLAHRFKAAGGSAERHDPIKKRRPLRLFCRRFYCDGEGSRIRRGGGILDGSDLTAGLAKFWSFAQDAFRR